jgi:hypothetical protein
MRQSMYWFYTQATKTILSLIPDYRELFREPVSVATLPVRSKRQVFTTSSRERAQAIGRARNIGQRTTQHCASNDRTEI